MKFVLDTCVLSDGARPERFPRLAEWLDEQDPEDLAIASVTIGDLRYGIQRLGTGRKRELLKQWLDGELLPQFRDRILPVDAPAAEAWALLRASGDGMGRPLPIVDGFLLAIAQTHGLTLVTRDLKDVEGRGVSVLSPY